MLPAVILAIVLLVAWSMNREGTVPAETFEDIPSETQALNHTPVTDSVEVPTESLEVSAEETKSILLEDGLAVLDIGKYTGIYMEDGTNEPVTGMLMMVVKNVSDRDIQYAEITMPTSAGEARFTLSTLPVGECVLLLEQSRMLWTAEENYENITSHNVAYFTEELSLCEDSVKITALDGVMNVANISDEDIAGDIIVYYKNASEDLYYGGITYRVRIEGGLQADEIRQVTANHLMKSGSRIMFVAVV